MLSNRTETILNYIVEQYIDKVVPVSSQSIADSRGLNVSPATIRNEMADLEQEGYIIRPHTSAGCVPSDMGYRYYVDSLEGVKLSPAKQRLISHLFHQVEGEVEEWLSLTATLLAQLVRNVAVVGMPKPVVNCKFKYIELVALQDSLALVVLVLYGARVKQKLITFDQGVSQSKLLTIANKLNAAYSGLTSEQLVNKDIELAAIELQVRDYLVEMMQAEERQVYEESYLDGLHFILSQPEFARSERLRTLVELVEHRSLLKNIVPKGLARHGVHVIIGSENEAEPIHGCSVVISQYGLPDEAIGTIGVVGPTRMPYAETIPSVEYLSSVLSGLMAKLYGRAMG